MTYTGLQKDYMGGGLAAAIPAAATLGPTIPPGSCAFYFATDTNVLYRLAGGDVAWQVAAGGGGGGSFVLLEQHTAAGSASLDFTSAISSTYDEYLIELVALQPVTNNDHLILRMSTNGGATYDAGANYGYHITSFNRFSGGGGGADSGATALQLTSNPVTNAGVSAIVGSFRLFNPLSTTIHKFIRGDSGYLSLTTNELAMFMGEYQNIAAVNAFQVLFTGGNIAAGTVRCYGLAK